MELPPLLWEAGARVWAIQEKKADPNAQPEVRLASWAIGGKKTYVNVRKDAQVKPHGGENLETKLATIKQKQSIKPGTGSDGAERTCSCGH